MDERTYKKVERKLFTLGFLLSPLFFCFKVKTTHHTCHTTTYHTCHDILQSDMGKHSRNNTANAVFTSAERSDLRKAGYGSQKVGASVRVA